MQFTGGKRHESVLAFCQLMPANTVLLERQTVSRDTEVITKGRMLQKAILAPHVIVALGILKNLLTTAVRLSVLQKVDLDPYQAVTQTENIV